MWSGTYVSRRSQEVNWPTAVCWMASCLIKVRDGNLHPTILCIAPLCCSAFFIPTATPIPSWLFIFTVPQHAWKQSCYWLSRTLCIPLSLSFSSYLSLTHSFLRPLSLSFLLFPLLFLSNSLLQMSLTRRWEGGSRTPEFCYLTVL